MLEIYAVNSLLWNLNHLSFEINVRKSVSNDTAIDAEAMQPFNTDSTFIRKKITSVTVYVK